MLQGAVSQKMFPSKCKVCKGTGEIQEHPYSRECNHCRGETVCGCEEAAKKIDGVWRQKLVKGICCMCAGLGCRPDDDVNEHE
jgi:hypothetical protein